MATASDVEIDAASCSVCKDVFKDPVKISCGHTFCEDCINDSWKSKRDDPNCPICRKAVDGEKKVDTEMLTEMSKTSTQCNRCNKVVVLTEYRRHEKICKGMGIVNDGASASGIRRFPFSGDVKPNIYTFACPYDCHQNHLDRESLLQHVYEQHKGDQTKIVCPICKVMPWGNTDQFSQNFPDHLKLRHNFDYERFVDLNQDEEAALENTVRLSYRHH